MVTYICTEQTIDEGAKPVSLLDDINWDIDLACSDQFKSCLYFLDFGVSSLEVLVPVTHCPAIGFRKPQGSVVSRTMKMISQMCQAALQAERVDC